MASMVRPTSAYIMPDKSVGPTDEFDKSVGPTGEHIMPDKSVGPTDEFDSSVRPTDEHNTPDKSVRPTDEFDKSVGTIGGSVGVDSSLTKRQHHLPHWQQGGSVYFITFRSARGQLPTEALREVIKAIKFDDGKRYELYLSVAMPDHVHILLQPKEKKPGICYDLAEIMKGIKGISARRINQLFGTNGTVWQKESFDRIVRGDSEFLEKWNYMLNNPLKSGFVENHEDYEHILHGKPDKSVGSTDERIMPDKSVGPTNEHNMPDKSVGPTNEHNTPDKSVRPTK